MNNLTTWIGPVVVLLLLPKLFAEARVKKNRYDISLKVSLVVMVLLYFIPGVSRGWSESFFTIVLSSGSIQNILLFLLAPILLLVTLLWYSFWPKKDYSVLTFLAGAAISYYGVFNLKGPAYMMPDPSDIINYTVYSLIGAGIILLPFLIFLLYILKASRNKAQI